MEAVRERLEDAARLLEGWDSLLGGESPLDVPRSLRNETARWLASELTLPRYFTLLDAIRRQGYEPVLCEDPEHHPDALGSPSPASQVALLTGMRVALASDSWDLAYAVAHEIAEDRYGLRHSAEMFGEQANILSCWIRALAASKGHDVTDADRRVLEAMARVDESALEARESDSLHEPCLAEIARRASRREA
jgi:hypothetical protein